MSEDPLAEWWVHEVTIARFTGSTAYGDQHADPTPHKGFVNDKRRLVRSSSGDQVVSETTVLLPIGVGAIPGDSLMTLPAKFGGGDRKVIACAVHDGGGQDTPDHVELALD